jgi:hypothetical protein
MGAALVGITRCGPFPFPHETQDVAKRAPNRRRRTDKADLASGDHSLRRAMAESSSPTRLPALRITLVLRLPEAIRPRPKPASGEQGAAIQAATA